VSVATVCVADESKSNLQCQHICLSLLIDTVKPSSSSGGGDVSARYYSMAKLCGKAVLCKSNHASHSWERCARELIDVNNAGAE